MERKSALLVIDLQNAYLPGNEWACREIFNAICNIEKRIKEFPSDQIFFTQFIASSNPKGVWKDYNEKYATINSNEYLNDYVKEIKKYITEDNSFAKSEYSSLSNLSLLDKLRNFDVIYVTGVVAECCVLSTVLDLVDMGKKVVY